MLTIIWLNALTFISVMFIAFLIGKFFCIGFCETIYEALEDNDEALGFFLCFGCAGAFLLCVSWAGYVFNIDPVLYFIGTISTILNLIIIGILVTIWIGKCVVPWMEEVHSNIKYKKHGKY